MTVERRDKIITLEVSPREFFRSWLVWLRPLHRLTEKEMDIAAMMLEAMQFLSSRVKDEKKRGRIITSLESRKRMSDMIGMSDQYFGMLVSGLKKKGFIQGEGINPQYIPRIDEWSRSYAVTLNFLFHGNDSSLR